MEENNKILAYAIIAVAIAMFAGIFYTFLKKSNEIHERMDRVEKKIKKKEKEDKDEEEPEYIGTDAIVVPNVIGFNVDDAKAKLEEAGFEVDQDILEIEDNTIDLGKVAKVLPDVGTKRKKGTVVTIYISGEAKPVIIDDYTGKNINEVRGYLEAYGITVVVMKQENSDAPADTIVDQNIKKNTRLLKGNRIVLYVSAAKVVYPNFTDGNYRLEDVQSFCDKYGIKLTVMYDEVTTYEDGLVFYQDGCMPGEEVVAGCEMTIKVAQH